MCRSEEPFPTCRVRYMGDMTLSLAELERFYRQRSLYRKFVARDTRAPVGPLARSPRRFQRGRKCGKGLSYAEGERACRLSQRVSFSNASTRFSSVWDMPEHRRLHCRFHREIRVDHGNSIQLTQIKGFFAGMDSFTSCSMRLCRPPVPPRLTECAQHAPPRGDADKPHETSRA